ncbi:MAG: propanediol utilization protein, partial [Saprospiraceae bacterium]|nr:propanediol utilization protein [Saprospiraceae bacterium]
MKWITTFFLFFIASQVFVVAQNEATASIWADISPAEIPLSGEQQIKPDVYRTVRADVVALRTLLFSAPDEYAGPLTRRTVVLRVPNPDGGFHKFRITRYQMMEPALAAQYPGIGTWYGISEDKIPATIRLDWTERGFHALVHHSGESYFIDPFCIGNTTDYLVYFKKDYPQPVDPFICHTSERVKENLQPELTEEAKAGDCIFRSYRLALATTGEYSNFHGAEDASESGLVLSAVTTAINRVNEVFERDLAIRLVLIAGTTSVFYYDPMTDPYTNDDGNAMLPQNQTNINMVIGTANYDIGHVFSTGGGGVATLNSPCTGNKAKGVTGLPLPTGDPFYIDYVAHEMGHQFGARHTFNNSCGGARSINTAMEPGSGSTIMAYAGIMENNVQNNSDDYFTYRSILQIQNNLANKACANNTPLSNPVLTITSGGNWTIPNGTAFILTGTNPTNNPGATFTWEQNNTATNQVTGANSICYPTKPAGPNFRSLPPVSTPVRYMPALSSVLNNNLTTTWESVLTIQRTMAFTLTARDNVANNGQTSTVSASITTSGSIGPFSVTSQNTSGISWEQGSTQTITWNVNGTTGLTGSNNVDILLSTDGGQTFATVLASGTPNDGSHTITVPNVAAPFCRIMIKPTGNIYYALNTTPFSIGYTVTTTCNTYNYTTPFAIPDNGSTFTTASLNIPTNVTISDVNIGVNVTHSYLGDLLIAVLGPGNNQVNLFERQCAENQNLNVVFDGSGTTLACASPTVGTFQPAQTLNV